MSTAGQIIGGIAGATIGFFLGNPILGAQLGLMVGGAIDPPKGPSITGPRLEDLSVQTSTYGAPLPRGYGTVCVSGNIFWLAGDQIKETTTSEQQGGKGGGGQEVTTYHYSATFAVGLMHVPAGATVSLRRLWIDTDLIYEAGSSNVESVIASNNASGFTFYDGSDDQLPNPRMQADKGANNVSAYPGLCYLVFEDLSLEKYSNTLLRAQVKVELVIGSSTPTNAIYGPVYDSQTNSPQRREIPSITWSPTSCRYTIALETTLYNIPYAIAFYTEVFGEGASSFTVSVPDTWGTPYTWTSPMCVRAMYSDEPIAIFVQERLGSSTQRLRFITPTRDDYSPWYTNGEIAYGATTCAHGNGETFISWGPITKFVNIYYSCKTSGTYSIVFMGLSKNYLFGVKRDTSGTQTTVYKFLRADLSLVATYTSAVPNGVASIQVVDDDTFYTASGGNIYLWKNGVVIDQLNALTNINSNAGNSTPTHESFAVINDYPAFGYYIYQTSDATLENIEYFYAQVPATAAKLRTIVTNECSLAGIDAADLDLAALTNSDVRGFRVAQRGAVRNSLEPLQAAYPFDVAQSGYKIKFVSRGGASVASIPEQDLAASDGQPGVLLPVAREMGSQLPFRVAIRYTDPDREYDIGEQAVERYEKDSLNERVMELPLSLTSGEAIQMADVLLAKEWTERVDFGPFSLPPTWCHLEPSDVVTVTHRGQNYTLRLTRVEYLPDGRLVCNAKMTSAASYTSSATAQSPLVAGQSLVPLKGSTQAYLLDIPRIRSEQDVPGMSFALSGLASGWPGAALLCSDDSGNSYQAIGSANARARVFIASGTIGSHHGYSIDHGSVLTVTPRYSAHTLASVTEDQLYAHANLAAYGADGRWEIVSFKTAVDNTGSYSLKDFLRGLYGTEWTTGLHADGDYFIMLDTATVSFYGLPTAAIGSARLYRAITQGAALDSAPDMSHIYSGANIKPLTPVDINGSRDYSTFDWTIFAQRRTRSPVDLFSGVDVPLGETSEAYDLEIWDSGYANLKRTISSTSAAITYTSAQQIADFSGQQTNLYVRMYQKSSVVGRGFPLQTSISRYAPLDPYISFRKLLLHMNSTALADEFGHTINKGGTADYSTVQYKWSPGSLYLNGSSYLRTADSADWLLSGDFVIECWVYPTAIPAQATIISHWYAGVATNCSFHLGLSTTGKIVFSYGIGSTNAAVTGTTESVAVNTWTHVAVSRSGTTVRLFRNGTQDATTGTVSGALNNCPDELGIGVLSVNRSASNYFTGYIDDLRLTNGSNGGYTTTFTAPTMQFPDP